MVAIITNRFQDKFSKKNCGSRRFSWQRTLGAAENRGLPDCVFTIRFPGELLKCRAAAPLVKEGGAARRGRREEDETCDERPV